MDEYISREDVLDIASRYCPDDDESCSNADVDLREMLDEIEALPSEDVIPSAKVKDLQSQIADLKWCIKSLNSDYLTGYISALSAVEGMITKILGE